MTFSLVTVTRRRRNIVDGYWIQDHIGTLESAQELARKTSILNSNSDIAVVDQIRSTTSQLSFHEYLTSL